MKDETIKKIEYTAKETFQEYLMARCMEDTHALDDMLPDVYSDWITSQDVEDIIEYAEKWRNVTPTVSKVEEVEDIKKEFEKILDANLDLDGKGKDGTYLYWLTRTKEAKQYGTLTIDDFEEADKNDKWYQELLKELVAYVQPHLATSQHDRDIKREAVMGFENWLDTQKIKSEYYQAFKVIIRTYLSHQSSKEGVSI